MPIDWIILGPLLARVLADFISNERSRTGLTTEEIFARAQIKLDDNERKLLEDMDRLGMNPG